MKKILAMLLAFSIFSCAPRYIERPPQPDTLFEALNIPDNNRPKKDKSIMKGLLFLTAGFVLHILTTK